VIHEYARIKFILLERGKVGHRQQIEKIKHIKIFINENDPDHSQQQPAGLRCLYSSKMQILILIASCKMFC
jgi:hypothetical protein